MLQKGDLLMEIREWVNSLSPDIQLVIKLSLAALLGGLFGVERDFHGHEAGLRTNMMIAISSCLFTILSIEAFPLLPETGGFRDTARVAAQIVVGVGFLGAGAVIQARDRVRGLTTAATIWLVAAVGMAIGTGAYIAGIFTTIFALAVLVLLAPLSKRLERRGQNRAETRNISQSNNK
jgi:putative Mg2+ transporter-C (MgtC) family protein